MAEKRTGSMVGTFVEEFSGEYPEGLWVHAGAGKEVMLGTLSYPDHEYTPPRMIRAFFLFATEEQASSALNELRRAGNMPPGGIVVRRLSWLEIGRYVGAMDPDRLVLVDPDGQEVVLSQRHAQQD